jgi:hypothetical protein
MRTDDLIKALTADAGSKEPRVGQALVPLLGAGFALSAILFVLGLHVRADIAKALLTWRFDLKLALAALLAAAAGWLALRMARPAARTTAPSLAVLAVPLALVAAVVVELIAVPSSLWMPRAMGSNALWCLGSIPVLALAPLAAILLALRKGAPEQPLFCGAAAGLFAGALGAALYATHCWDDSPLFVAIWYPLGIAVSVLIGALAGSRLLRW